MFPRCCNFEILRNVIEFKHVRLKSSSNDSLKEKIKFSTEFITHRSKILCKTFNCNVLTAQEIITKSQEMEEISHQKFSLNAEFCKNYFKLSDIVEFPSLLTMPPSLLQHRYFSLKELGFLNVTPYFIFRFSSILKTTPKELKKRGFPLVCEYKSSILSQYLNTDEKAKINDKLQNMYTDGSDLCRIRQTMNAEFLSAKLECSIGAAHHMLNRNAALRFQSILNTEQLLNILLYKCGFPISKLHKTVAVLSVHHEAVELFLSEFPEILGVSTLFLIKRVPLLLKQESDLIRKTESILKDFDISKDQLICCPKVIAISPSTLHKRLTALCNTEEFAVLKSNKKFLWLVYYYKNLNSRLNSLKAEGMTCSINMFTVTKETFEKYLLCSNKRIPTEPFIYLADVFKINAKEIIKRFQHSCQDQNCCTLNCRKVLEFLLLSGVSKNQILNGLEIVYFDVETVKIHFDKLKNHPLCQPYEEWASHDNFIQLLIYIIQTNDCFDEDLHLMMSSN